MSVRGSPNLKASAGDISYRIFNILLQDRSKTLTLTAALINVQNERVT